MDELLTQTYYGNTIQDWAIALGIILGSVILGRAVFWVFSRIVRMFTSRTKTQFDDILVDMVEEPAVAMIIASGIWFGLQSLVLPEGLSDLVGDAYHVVVALMIGWLLSRLFDAMYKEYIAPVVANSDTDLDDQLAPILSKGVKIIIWSLAIIIGWPVLRHPNGAPLQSGLMVGAIFTAVRLGILPAGLAAAATFLFLIGRADK